MENVHLILLALLTTTVDGRNFLPDGFQTFIIFIHPENDLQTQNCLPHVVLFYCSLRIQSPSQIVIGV